MMLFRESVSSDDRVYPKVLYGWFEVRLQKKLKAKAPWVARSVRLRPGEIESLFLKISSFMNFFTLYESFAVLSYLSAILCTSESEVSSSTNGRSR